MYHTQIISFDVLDQPDYDLQVGSINYSSLHVFWAGITGAVMLLDILARSIS